MKKYKTMKRKIGQMATPKDFPILQGKISEISTLWEKKLSFLNQAEDILKAN